MNSRLILLVAVLGWCASVQASLFDIAPFARRCPGEDTYRLTTTFDYAYAQNAPPSFTKRGESFIYALQWAEERDVAQVIVEFEQPVEDASIIMAYWFQNWPYPPPTMPTIEDPVDDPWQGRWLVAKMNVEHAGAEYRLTCVPLTAEENPKAGNLPGVRYRRTLKIRLSCAAELPRVRRVRVFTESQEKVVPVRISFGVTQSSPAAREGELEVYNGRITQIRTGRREAGEPSKASFRIGAAQALEFEVTGTEPAPAGSHDITVVTVRTGEGTFSFALPDAERGPLFLPDFDVAVTVTLPEQRVSLPSLKPGERIRERLAVAPEQTLERASREIPSLDPVERQGGRLYLPLSIDSSWQKFAFEWGGNVFISKNGTKAKGAERQRLEWPNDRLSWRIGTGATPAFRPASRDSNLRVAENYLPMAIASWRTGEIEYVEEAFATPLIGPISFEGRDEQTPVVLLLQITARNVAATPQESHLWLGISPANDLVFQDGFLVETGKLVRAFIPPGGSTPWRLETTSEQDRRLPSVHLQSTLAPGRQETSRIALPFIPGLTSEQRQQLATLDWAQERAKVSAYWRNVAEMGIRFEVPERRFVDFSRAMLVHMHLSTARDPKSGLLMVPAASYSYQVFANESCFQSMALDFLGDHDTAARYLETLVQLQGSRPFRGTYTDDQKAVYHGARVDATYDYTASEYNLDHGTVLWALAEHYFITRDQAWLSRAAPSMIRAADWVTQQRQQTMLTDQGDKIPEYGLLPAGHLEDNADWGHWFAVNAYASAGISRLAEALRETQHAQAARLERDAAAYRKDLRAALTVAMESAPVTRLRDNTWVPFVPVRPHQRQRMFGPLRVGYYSRYPNPVLPTYRLSATREILYGPLILLNLGIYDGREPIANWLLDDWEDNLTMSSSLGLNVHGWVDDDDWFSRGGMVFQANLQNPVLAYLRRQEIPAALRNLYNDFVSCYYPDVNVFTEEYRQWRSPSGPFYKVPDEARFVTRLRDLLVREEDANLWLLSGTPRRWLEVGQTIRFRKMPTTFGPVDLELQSGQDQIDVRITLPTRVPIQQASLVLRTPGAYPITSVQLNGVDWHDFQGETIRLPRSPGGELRVLVKHEKAAHGS